MTMQIDAAALKALLDRGAVKVVDGSWALDGTDMKAAFADSHIPGAVFFDLESVCDHSTALPHMAPSPEVFAAAVGAMGISEADTVVVYDRQGLFSAARVWWTFRLMGHADVRVLRGGLPAWIAAGYDTSHAIPAAQPVAYTPRIQPDMVMDLNGLRESLDKPSAVLDARPAARFEGIAPEPRAGLRSGHMPGARSLPFDELIRNGALKPADELRALFSARGVDTGTRVVTTCGSGVTAAVLSLALAELGHGDVRLYDGSWAEWGQETLDTPVVTGP
ncbi:MAG: 3-mercaptopyruvate sulfurtransferase [Asticcacaulis sp.]